MLDKRQDQATAEKITEALRMSRAFGQAAGLKFLRRRNIDEALGVRVLAAPPSERRQY